jgi:hypothetical protein
VEIRTPSSAMETFGRAVAVRARRPRGQAGQCLVAEVGQLLVAIDTRATGPDEDSESDDG